MARRPNAAPTGWRVGDEEIFVGRVPRVAGPHKPRGGWRAAQARGRGADDEPTVRVPKIVAVLDEHAEKVALEAART